MAKRRRPVYKRLSVRVPTDLYYSVKDLAHRDSYSLNKLDILALQHYVDWVHSDYDIPSLDRRRVNQLTDGIQSLQNTTGTKLDAVLRMLSTLLAFTHGENYYADHGQSTNRDNEK